MGRSTEQLRAELLEAAERQLSSSADAEISTRTVCEAVGVTQPVLYRIFGDKQGLLDALAEVGLRRYAHQKSMLEVSDDPVRDLHSGWDHHMAFAAEHPALYQLMFSPRRGVETAARDGVHDLVKMALTRCAAAGELRVNVDTAAALILSANVGLAFNRMTQPERYGDPDLSAQLRTAVFDQVLQTASSPKQSDAAPVSAARQLASQLELIPPAALRAEEVALLQTWLQRMIEDTSAPRTSSGLLPGR